MSKANIKSKVFIPRNEEEFKRMVETLFTEKEVMIDVVTYISFMSQLIANEIVHTVTPIANGTMIIINISEDSDYKVKVVKKEDIPKSFFEGMPDIFN